MTMSFRWLDENRKVLADVREAACFAYLQIGYEDVDPSPTYFQFRFPHGEMKEVRDYLESLREVYDFRKYMGKFDFKHGTIDFDLRVVPGHKILAICTLIRMVKEYPLYVTQGWACLNNPDYFKPMGAVEKLLLIHAFGPDYSSSHHLFRKQHLRGEMDSYLKTPTKLVEPIFYKVEGDLAAPFKEIPSFFCVSLHNTYSPETLPDSSFRDFFRSHLINEEGKGAFKLWSPAASL